MPDCERVGLDFIDNAPVVAHAVVTVEATPAQVWQVLNATERWPEWFDGMKSAVVTSPQWDGIGSTRRVKVGALTVDEEIIAWEPEQHWGFCATKLAWTGYVARKFVETVQIAPEGTGSQLRYTGALEPVPWVKPVAGFLEKQLRTGWSTSLANIDGQI